MKWIIILLLLQSCATYGPESEKKSPLNYLSGDHYHSDITSGSVPILLERIEKNTTISGKCFFVVGNDDFKYSLKFKKLLLLRDGQKKAEAATDGLGNFIFSAPLSNGEYDIKVDHTDYSGEKKIKISYYEIKNIEIV